MPLRAYGVLAGWAVQRVREGANGSTPHYQVHMQAGDVDVRVAVNVQSAEAPSELRYFVDEDFDHPLLPALVELPMGWTALSSSPGGAALDFIRGNLFDPAAMRVLPADVPGADNDLADMLDAHLLRAIDDPTATVYAFGEPWGPEPAVPDNVFGFTPGAGVHDIHMNQGNSAQFANDDGAWQDGALLIGFASVPRWVAVFLAFQSQAWHTDDRTGHALGQQADPLVRVVAAMVNPVGPAPEAESVTVLNVSPDAVDLAGWALADRAKNRTPLPDVRLAAGAALQVPVAAPFQLGNSGGAITLLDPEGLKVHGVAYTGGQASREGWTATF